MAELYNIWNDFFSRINEIEKVIEPYAKRSMLSTDEGIVLSIISDYGLNKLFFNKEVVDSLCKKNLIECTENGLKVTSKGAIISKSIIGALKKV